MSLEHLFETESRWLTHKGKAYLSDRVVMHGKDLHKELGEMDWIHLYLYAILGRDPGENVAKLLNFYWVSTSYPDASIWPNHVTALAGTVRTTPSLALMAGMSVSEASIYGRRPEVRALDFFYRAGQWCDDGGHLEDFVDQEKQKGRILYGYGRPLAKTDERISYTLDKARELGLAGGRYLQMALDVHQHLDEKYGYSMNVAAVHAGLAADMGLTCQEYQLFLTPCFVTGMAPCYQDTRDKPEGSFFPVRCESIVYGGPAKRKWLSD
ncbi:MULTISPECIES: citrate/2-methylcitrate synthase [Marinobacter]|jgi:hypothetical protein|uniref:Uncharacterized protein n=1 Tax=Marinobacter salarius TaxID=1420917 RepID=W5YQD0_9GAMM|nr:citrate/2-methylcitrate synthase [Marinobacter salarius]AHI31326.1 hypothetical protein AU15_08250 [Marinobacter salarius]MBS8232483.1 hypothetical protein [Marinobacter salarius]HIO01191.1 hypothetical protein [Alphaproteobacteria bacterium]|tara:strand:+ start:4615 stop:5415 length:801 start_codon:yes stop_codon:yes gene_type:complete